MLILVNRTTVFSILDILTAVLVQQIYASRNLYILEHVNYRRGKKSSHSKTMQTHFRESSAQHIFKIGFFYYSFLLEFLTV